LEWRYLGNAHEALEGQRSQRENACQNLIKRFYLGLNEASLRVSLLLPGSEMAFPSKPFPLFRQPRNLPSLPFCFPPLRRHLALPVRPASCHNHNSTA
jgi:hypothetical protein